jgi:hypothetical protein
MFDKLTAEFRFFQTMPHSMRVLLITNMLYALVLTGGRNIYGCLHYAFFLPIPVMWPFFRLPCTPV